MKFLSPTIDIAFKKLFGSQERSDLTISFLNSVLERREGELITLVQINDNANRPITKDKERTFVDVHCTDQKGNKYIIEVQVEDERNFMERSQFYASFFLVRQLERKMQYANLVPVIFVGVLDFNLFKDDPDYLSHHFITNKKTGKRTLKHLEWHFIELKKFTKTLEELVTPLEKWTYFLKHANEMNQVPASMKTPHELVTAFDVLAQHFWSEEELQQYYAELDAWRCSLDFEQGVRREAREEARAEALAEGRAEGRLEGRETGRAEGRVEGREAGRVEGREAGRAEGLEAGRAEGLEAAALSMLKKGIDVATISEITGLPKEKIIHLASKAYPER